jgi:hypothetical protein
MYSTSACWLNARGKNGQKIGIVSWSFQLRQKGRTVFGKGILALRYGLSQPVASEKKCRWVSSLRIDDTILQLDQYLSDVYHEAEKENLRLVVSTPKEYGDYHLVPSYTKK